MKKFLTSALVAVVSLTSIFLSAPAYAGGASNHPNYQCGWCGPHWRNQRVPRSHYYRPSPKHYQPRHQHQQRVFVYRNRDDNGFGAAIALGIVGLAVGAMIADSANRAEQREYYPQAPDRRLGPNSARQCNRYSDYCR